MSQTERIRRHLEAGKTLTQLQAYDKFNCTRLAGRVHDLREDGMAIISERVKRNGKTFARYRVAA